jgi:hypothetical protein
VAQKKIAPADKLPERFREIRVVSLADLGAEKFAVALDAHFSAGQQVSDGCNRFFRVRGAGTHGQDEIAQGKFRTGF